MNVAVWSYVMALRFECPGKGSEIGTSHKKKCEVYYNTYGKLACMQHGATVPLYTHEWVRPTSLRATQLEAAVTLAAVGWPLLAAELVVGSGPHAVYASDACGRWIGRRI
eukprot:COSAG02_NODE_13057_length_1451_cov_454.759615_1_plen_110_part_00